jgi:hypothetical protein
MKTFEEILKEFEEVIGEKYMPFRDLYSEGISLEEIDLWYQKQNLTFHPDIISFFQWTNGPRGSNEIDVENTEIRLFEDYWSMDIQCAIEDVYPEDPLFVYERNVRGNQNAFIRLFNDDFGEALFVDTQTSGVFYSDDYNQLDMRHETLYVMMKTLTQKYIDETYKFYIDEQTGRIELDS